MLDFVLTIGCRQAIRKHTAATTGDTVV